MYDAYRCAKARVTVVVPHGNQPPISKKCGQKDWKLQKSDFTLSAASIAINQEQAEADIKKSGYHACGPDVKFTEK